MRILIHISLLFSALFTISCNQDDMHSDSGSILNDNVVVLKEREVPWAPSDFTSKTKLKNSAKGYSGLPHRDFLGYSLKNNSYPLEDTKNISGQVVNIEKLSKDYPSYVKSWKNNIGDAHYYSYATFDRYTNNSKVTKIVNGGFSLNLGLFSIGNKTNTKTVFTNNFTEEQNATFGELNIVIRDSIHRMQYSTEIQKKINANYLSKDFKEELYNTHPSEFFKNYGGFVLADFIVGGKATAVYAGLYKKEEEEEIKEKNMNTEISASYKYDGDKKGDSISGDLTLGRDNYNQTSVTNEFTSIMMAVKTIGGNSSFAAFSIPKEVKDININLSGWVGSLTDKSTHSIVEIPDDGLIPICDFIVERNLQNQIKSYYATGVNAIEVLTEPYIMITFGSPPSPVYTAVKTELHTRFGNVIELKNKTLVPTSGTNIYEMINNYVKSESDRVHKLFGVKVTSHLPGFTRSSSGETPVFLHDFDLYSEGDLKKFIHDGIIYIVSDYVITQPSHPLYMKKYALSIHNDRIIDEYAMRDLFNRLPSIDLDYENFTRSYIIDAL